MGAHTFAVFGKGDAVAEVFEQLRKNDRIETGDDAYSGDIKQKNRYHIVRSDAVDMATANREMDDLINKEDPRVDDPNGPCGAIRVKDPTYGTGWFFFGWAKE